jgi:hypothetical protein
VALAIPEHGPLVLFMGLLGEAIPRAVAASTLVEDEMVIEEDFIVLGTPGHTPGHLAFFHRPTRTLVAGDALAAKWHRAALMARPVTPDVPTAVTRSCACSIAASRSASTGSAPGTSNH